MDTKRINQLPVADALTENTNVLIEADGSTQRIPADKIVPIDGADGQVLTYQDGKAVWVDVPSGLPTTVPVIRSASVGQTVVVKAVDESGKPTEWEAADMASGGGGVAFINLKKSTPTVWDAASGQFIPLTREKFIELFNVGTIRVVEDVFTTDPTVPDWGNSKVRGTVVGYYINSNTAKVTVASATGQGVTGDINAWV